MSLNLVSSLVEKTWNDVLFFRRNGQGIQHNISMGSLGPTLLRDGDSRAEVGLHLTEYFDCQFKQYFGQDVGTRGTSARISSTNSK